MKLKALAVTMIIFLMFSLHSFSNFKDDIYSLFDFYLGETLESNKKLAEQRELLLKKQGKYHLLYEGSFWLNSEINFRIRMAFEGAFVYEIAMDFVAKSKDFIEPFYVQAEELARKHINFYRPRDIYKSEEYGHGKQYRRGDLLVDISKFLSADNKFVAQVNYRLHSYCVKSDALLEILADDGWIIKSKDPDLVSRIPDYLEGQKVYWPGENENIIDAEPLHTVPPEYPGFEGIAIVAGIIDVQGKVRIVRATVYTFPILAELAEKAVKQWRFKPAMLNGKPINLVFTVTIHFKKK